MGIAGKVMPRPMGDYADFAVYNILDIVNHDGLPWICKQSGTQNIEPTVENTDHWQKLFDADVMNADTLDGYDSSYFLSKGEAAKITTVVFPANEWAGTAAPYTQTRSIPGVKSTDTPVAFLSDNSTSEAISKKLKKEYGYISYFDSVDGAITATCKYRKPTSALNISFKGV